MLAVWMGSPGSFWTWVSRAVELLAREWNLRYVDKTELAGYKCHDELLISGYLFNADKTYPPPDLRSAQPLYASIESFQPIIPSHPEAQNRSAKISPRGQDRATAPTAEQTEPKAGLRVVRRSQKPDARRNGRIDVALRLHSSRRGENTKVFIVR